jgi:hypothetical protein
MMKMNFFVILLGLFVFLGWQAAADSIVIDGKEHTGVYVRESASRYYVQIPETGEVLSVSKEAVAADQVALNEDAGYRAELLARWQATKSAQEPVRQPRITGNLSIPSPIISQGVSAEVEGAIPQLAMRGSASTERLTNSTVSDGMVPYVRLKNVPLGQALDGMLRPLGLDYEVRNNYVYISTPARLRTEPFERVQTRFYQVSGHDTLPKIVLRQGALYGAQGGYSGYGGGYGGMGMGGYGGGGYGGGMGGYGGGIGGYGGGMGGYGGGMGGYGGGMGGGMMGGVRDVTVISNISDMFDTIDDRRVGEEPYYATRRR